MLKHEEIKNLLELLIENGYTENAILEGSTNKILEFCKPRKVDLLKVSKYRGDTFHIEAIKLLSDIHTYIDEDKDIWEE
jgi:hypothetical protein